MFSSYETAQISIPIKNFVKIAWIFMVLWAFLSWNYWAVRGCLFSLYSIVSSLWLNETRLERLSKVVQKVWNCSDINSYQVILNVHGAISTCVIKLLLYLVSFFILQHNLLLNLTFKIMQLCYIFLHNIICIFYFLYIKFNKININKSYNWY